MKAGSKLFMPCYYTTPTCKEDKDSICLLIDQWTQNISNGVHKLSQIAQEKASFANNPECNFHPIKQSQQTQI